MHSYILSGLFPINLLLTLLTLSKAIQFCTLVDKNAEVCTEEFAPVCGYYNELKKCTTYPCASNFPNSCHACRSKHVASWEIGNCPTDSYVCSATEKLVGSCPVNYLATCAFYDSSITCEKMPCMRTFANTCYACRNAKVTHVQIRKCPELTCTSFECSTLLIKISLLILTLFVI